MNRSAAANQKLKICFLSLYSYPFFNPACVSPFGGSEARISLIAKELAKYADLEVAMIVFDHGQPRVEKCNGVTIYAWPDKYCPLRADDPWSGANFQADSVEGIRDNRRQLMARSLLKCRLYCKAHLPKGMVNLLRRIRYPLATVVSKVHRGIACLKGEKLFGSIQSHTIRSVDVKIYDKIGADIYLGLGNHDLNANLAFYCRHRNKKFVMISGSDHDFIAAREARTKSTDIYSQLRFLMVYTIENANLIFVQTEKQATLASSLFGREAVVIPNPVDTAPRFERASMPRTILWIGKSDDRVKQPELFIELARRKSGCEFLMIMNLAIDSIHRRILQQAKDVPNLKILTYVPYEQVEKYFAEAILLVNTSLFEGFPDTFLQASKYGIPVVSLRVDPDGMLSKHGCGIECGNDFERMVRELTGLLNDEGRRRETGVNCMHYLRMHHDKEVLIPRYYKALRHLVDYSPRCG